MFHIVRLVVGVHISLFRSFINFYANERKLLLFWEKQAPWLICDLNGYFTMRGH